MVVIPPGQDAEKAKTLTEGAELATDSDNRIASMGSSSNSFGSSGGSLGGIFAPSGRNPLSNCTLYYLAIAQNSAHEN